VDNRRKSSRGASEKVPGSREIYEQTLPFNGGRVQTKGKGAEELKAEGKPDAYAK